MIIKPDCLIKKGLEVTRGFSGSHIILDCLRQTIQETHHEGLVVPAALCCNGPKLYGILSRTATTLSEFRLVMFYFGH